MCYGVTGERHSQSFGILDAPEADHCKRLKQDKSSLLALCGTTSRGYLITSGEAHRVLHERKSNIAANAITDSTGMQVVVIDWCHVGTVHSSNNIGLICQNRGLFKDSEGCHRDVFSIK